MGAAQIRTVQACAAQVGEAQVRTTQAGVCEVGPPQAGTDEPGSPEVGKAQIGIGEIGIREIGEAQIGNAEEGPGEARVAGARAGQVEMLETLSGLVAEIPVDRATAACSAVVRLPRRGHRLQDGEDQDHPQYPGGNQQGAPRRRRARPQAGPYPPCALAAFAHAPRRLRRAVPGALIRRGLLRPGPWRIAERCTGAVPFVSTGQDFPAPAALAAMQISLPAVAPTTTAPAPRAGVAWTVGQLLTAEVIGTPAPNYTRLRIGTETFTARNEVPLSAGQKLELRVAANTPNVVLQVRTPGPAETPGAAIARGLARSLPRQGSAAETLVLLRTLDRLAVGSAPAAPRPAPGLPGTLRAAAGTLLSGLPDSATLRTPAQLRAAIVAAATPPEARLRDPASATTRPAAAGERPTPLAALHALQRALPPATAHGATPGPEASPSVASPRQEAAQPLRPSGAGAAATNVAPAPGGQATPSPALAGIPEADLDVLRGLVDGALARIQTQHLGNATQPTGAPWHIGVELPVRHDDRVDLWQFDFEGDARTVRGEPATGAARVTLRLVLSDTVTFSAQLASHADGLRVRVTSDDPAYAAALAATLDELERALRARDLPVAGVAVGAVAAPRTQPTAPCALVDVAV